MSEALLTKLERLVMTETSGVDDPANMTPGWMVLKARDPQVVAELTALCRADLEGFKKAAAQFNAEVEEYEKALRIQENPQVRKEFRRLVLEEAAKIPDTRKARHNIRHPKSGRFVERRFFHPAPVLAKQWRPNLDFLTR
jgi:hypothetical protein